MGMEHDKLLEALNGAVNVLVAQKLEGCVA